LFGLLFRGPAQFLAQPTNLLTVRLARKFTSDSLATVVKASLHPVISQILTADSTIIIRSAFACERLSTGNEHRKASHVHQLSRSLCFSETNLGKSVTCLTLGKQELVMLHLRQRGPETTSRKRKKKSPHVHLGQARVSKSFWQGNSYKLLSVECQEDSLDLLFWDPVLS
jgi:hypothetical protein